MQTDPPIASEKRQNGREVSVDIVELLTEWIDRCTDLGDQSALRLREFLESELNRRTEAGRKGGRPVERTDPDAEARRRAYRVRMLKKRGIRE